MKTKIKPSKLQWAILFALLACLQASLSALNNSDSLLYKASQNMQSSLVASAKMSINDCYNEIRIEGKAYGWVLLSSWDYPNDLWQRVDVENLEVWAEMETKYRNEDDAYIYYTLPQRNGSVTFKGKATSKNYGATEVFQFEQVKLFSHGQQSDGLAMYSKQDKKITYVDFPLSNSTNYPNAYNIRFIPDTIQVRCQFPSNWWFRGAYDIFDIPGSKVIEPLQPVVLVHGWRADSTVWDSIINGKKLDNSFVGDFTKIGYKTGENLFVFNYKKNNAGDCRLIAKELKIFIDNLKNNNPCIDKVDIICHSFGAMVSRWYMKDGGDANVRQWIGLAPVNSGVASADFEIFIPDFLRLFIPKLIGTDIATTQMKIKSPILSKLNYDLDEFSIEKWGEPQLLSKQVIYRNLMAIKAPGWKTLGALKDDKNEIAPYLTKQGDGLVATAQSVLKGNNVGNEQFFNLDHNGVRNSFSVISQVIDYVKNPALPLINSYSLEDSTDDHHFIVGQGNRGYIYKNQEALLSFMIDGSITKAEIALAAGSEGSFKFRLITPSGRVLGQSGYPVLDYAAGPNFVWYTIDKPETGKWTAKLLATGLPESFANGTTDTSNSYSFMTLLSTPIMLNISIPGNQENYVVGQKLLLTANVSNSQDLIKNNDIRVLANLPDGDTISFTLFDDGRHDDQSFNDGIYGNTFLLPREGSYHFTVTAINENLSLERTKEISISVSQGINSTENNQKYSSKKLLFQNYPNPFNEKTVIKYTVQSVTPAKILIYNLKGDLVRTLLDTVQMPGKYSVEWNGKNNGGILVSDGVYIYTLETNQLLETRRMLFAK